MKKPFTKLLLDQPHNVIFKYLKTRAKNVSKQQVPSLTRMPVVSYKSVQDIIRGNNDSMS